MVSARNALLLSIACLLTTRAVCAADQLTHLTLDPSVIAAGNETSDDKGLLMMGLDQLGRE